MAARTRTASVIGVEGHLVEVEADIAQGLPATFLTGLPGTVLSEARDRVRAAIVNSGERWPCSKITVGLYPAMLPKRGSAYDLAIAIAIMAANGDLPVPPETAMFLAELGLDGRLRPVPGVLPAALAAARAEVTTIVVATANQAEASLVPGMTVIAADSLAGVAGWLRGGPPPHWEPPGPGGGDGPVAPQPQPNLADGLGVARWAGLRERSQTPSCFFGDLLVLGAKRALEGVACSGVVTLACQQAPEAERCGVRQLWVRRIDRALVGISCGCRIAVAFQQAPEEERCGGDGRWMSGVRCLLRRGPGCFRVSVLVQRDREVHHRPGGHIRGPEADCGVVGHPCAV
jgi:hypothetical protein